MDMILHVVLSEVCGFMVFAFYIPNISLISMNYMSPLYIFHAALHVTFFTLFLVLWAFFFINLPAIIKMVMYEVITRILLYPFVV